MDSSLGPEIDLGELCCSMQIDPKTAQEWSHWLLSIKSQVEGCVLECETLWRYDFFFLIVVILGREGREKGSKGQMLSIFQLCSRSPMGRCNNSSVIFICHAGPNSYFLTPCVSECLCACMPVCYHVHASSSETLELGYKAFYFPQLSFLNWQVDAKAPDWQHSLRIKKIDRKIEFLAI